MRPYPLWPLYSLFLILFSHTLTAQIVKIDLPHGYWAFQIAEDKKGNIWVGLSDGDTKGDLALVKNDSLIIKSGTPAIPSGSYHTSFSIHGNKLLFGGSVVANGKHYLIQIENNTIDTIPVAVKDPHFFVNSINLINNQDTWLATSAGVIYAKGSAWYQLTAQDGLPHSFVNTIMQDFRGTVWIGTENGLAQFFDGQLQNLSHSDRTLNSVTQLFNDNKGYLWSGSRFSSEGVGVYNGKNWEVFSARHGLKDNATSFFFQDSKGVLWAGSCYHRTRGGLSAFDNRQWTAYSYPQHLSKPCVDAIAEDALGRIWIGGSLSHRKGSGITIYDGDQWIQIKPGKEFPVNRVISFFVDSQEQIWISAIEGLFVVNPMQLDIHSIKQ